MRIPFSTLTIAMLLACGTFEPVALPDCRLTRGLPGPEDLDLDEENSRLIVSSQERRETDPNGEFLRMGAIYAVPVDAEGPGEPTLLPLAGRDELPFRPHGISITKSGGKTYLYVINHALSNLHSIEIFELHLDELRFVKRLHDPLLVSPNDLLALPNGQIYVTNDHAYKGFAGFLETALSLNLSTVVLHRNGVWKTVAEDIAYANSVAVNRRGDRFYVSATRDEGLHVFVRNPVTGDLPEKIGFIDVGSGVDNLLWQDEEWLLTAAHPDSFAFLDHVKSEQNHSPSEAYRISVKTGEVRRIFADDGSLIDASSTALIFGGWFHVSQVFDPEILSCRMEYGAL